SASPRCPSAPRSSSTTARSAGSLAWSSGGSPPASACSCCSTFSSGARASSCPSSGCGGPEPPMTSPRRTALLAALKLADLGVVVAAFVVALCSEIPGAQSWSEVLAMRIEVRNVLFMAAYLGYWHLVLLGFGLYRSHRLAPISREWRDLLSAVLLAATPLFVLSRFFRFEYADARFFVNFSLFAFVGLATERRLFRVFARTMRRHGRNLRNAIVVGLDEEALEMASRLARRADLGYRIVEVLETTPAAEPTRLLERLARVVARNPIDEVFVAAPLDAGQPLIRGVLALCEEQGITVFTGPPDSPLLAVKRLIDITVSLTALILLAPVFAIIALAIRLDSPGPVFFVQRRVGLGGRQFNFYKFRTMVEDAERLQPALEHLNEADGPVFKIRDDPRVTRVGRWVRRASLDELPQLINVLKGDMSLVGPRPLPLRDVARMDVPAHRRRFSVK